MLPFQKRLQSTDVLVNGIDHRGVHANLLLLFQVSGLFAWLIAGGQVILGIIEFRKGNSLWKHHLASALWTFTCYAIVIALMSNGYLLTA